MSRIIDIKGLTTGFGRQAVHQSLDFCVNQGERIALIGGSGSGKTVLLRTLLMLNRPLAGKITVFGHDFSQLTPASRQAIQKRTGVLFQQSALFGALTVLDNVIYPLKQLTQLPSRLQTELALLKLHWAGLSLDAVHRYPAELSGGMKKRAALARALALDPSLLILDEPTAGLDPASAGAFDDLIINLQRALGLTLVLVTHDLDTLALVPDRVAFLGEGKILSMGPVQTVAQDPHPKIQAFFSSHRGQLIKQQSEQSNGR